MLRKIFTENKNSIDICMECRYSPSFKKWVPIRCVKHEPYTISDIEKKALDYCHKVKPIFDDIDVNFEVSKDELSSYNYITYIKLK